jgi:hypothetical protein
MFIGIYPQTQLDYTFLTSGKNKYISPGSVHSGKSGKYVSVCGVCAT